MTGGGVGLGGLGTEKKQSENGQIHTASSQSTRHTCIDAHVEDPVGVVARLADPAAIDALLEFVGARVALVDQHVALVAVDDWRGTGDDWKGAGDDWRRWRWTLGGHFGR